MTEAGDRPLRFEPVQGLTVGEACLKAASYLSEQGVDEGRANAERLLQHLLGIEPAGLLRDWRDPFPAERGVEWTALVSRKAAGEPVQYIVGEQWFYGLPFTVTPAVLIPRPETELLVEALLAAADRLWPGAAGREPAPGSPAPTVVDVGTGSGAIAVTLAARRPAWRVCASDLSEDALAVARLNAARHGAIARMAFAQGDLLRPFTAKPAGENQGEATDGIGAQGKTRMAVAEPAGAKQEAAEDGTGTQGEPQADVSASRRAHAERNVRPPALETAGLRIDVLVSNPPYIPAADIEGLQREVRDHEPRLALDGGEDGLEPYRRMLAQLPALAAIPRIVAFELGQGQAREVAQMLRDTGYGDEVRIIEDYAGIERHVIGLRSQIK